MSGSLTVIIGPMFCGKTTELIRLKSRSDIAGRKTLVIKYQGDNRYHNSQLGTHSGVKIPALNSCGKKLKSTFNLIENLHEYVDIYIDEIQFYDDAVEVCDDLANQGYNVYVSGLQGDINRQPFPIVSKLIPIADKIIHLTAIDKDTGKDAPFSALITQFDRPTCVQETIGGADLYQAVDRRHYLNLKLKLS